MTRGTPAGREATTTQRLFLAVDLDAPTRDAFAARLALLDLPGRLVAASHWHVTLAFLGATAPDARDRLCARLDALDAGARFTVAFGPLGAFPRPSRASVLWIGVTTGAAALTALHGRVTDAVRAAGLPLDARPFTPHVTVSRLRPPADVRRLVDAAPADDVTMRVDAVTLFRSVPSGGGTRYEIVQQVPLAR